MTLLNKVAVVSGGSRGIGRCIVQSMARKGARVAFTYLRNSDAAEKVVRECGAGDNVVAFKVDIREQAQVNGMMSDIIKKWEDIDIIVNNAGVKRDRTLAFMSSEEWHDVIQTNLNGAFYLTKAAVFYFLKKRQGRVINICSLSGISGLAGQTNYSSSKAALIGFTRSLAKELAPYGIAVNAVAPGPVDTDMVKNMKEKDYERLLQGIPIGRVGTPEEVTQVVMFLADDEASPLYLTGAVIPLDGGYGL